MTREAQGMSGDRDGRGEDGAGKKIIGRVVFISGPDSLYKKGRIVSLRHHPTPVFSVNNKIVPFFTSASFCSFLSLL
jgi:hypothetical protein